MLLIILNKRMPHRKTRLVPIGSVNENVYNIIDNLDKSFSERRKARRRQKYEETNEKKELTVPKTQEQTETYKHDDDEKEREKFRKMGYVRRVNHIADDVEELRKITFDNRNYIRDIYTKLEVLNKIHKVKFNAQQLQKELLQFLTYGVKEGHIIIENGKFARIEE